MKKITLFFIICLLLSYGVKVYADKSDPLEIMTKKSDLIVIGKITNEKVTREGELDMMGTGDLVPVTGGTFEIDVEDVVKGSVIKNNKIAGNFDILGGSSPLKMGEKVILFLEKQNGEIRLLGNIVINGKDKVDIWDGEGYYSENITVSECMERIKKYMALGREK